MLYKFHITGYAGCTEDDFGYNGDHPIDVTVYACTVADALEKLHDVTGEYISLTHRRIVIEEIPEF